MPPLTSPARPSDVDRAAAQRRTVATLTAAQVFSSLGNGSTLALGSVLAVELSGRESLAGTATTALGLGAALSAMPLSRLAAARGRRVALGTGLVVAICGTFAMVGAVLTSSFALLLLGTLLVGVATAVNLQARFAATDLSEPRHRGRDLSLVVWAITVGAVLGPNTVAPGAVLSRWLGLPPYAGAFLISAAGMTIGGLVVLTRLRPDPLLLRLDLDGGPAPTRTRTSWATGARLAASTRESLAALLVLIGAHATMVGVMSMTPLHLTHRMHGAEPAHVLTIIGITISLHIAGMYALSPVMGVAADRFGAPRVAGAGLVVSASAAVLAALAHADVPIVTAALALLGVGWSAASIAGATMLTEALPAGRRVEAQGFVDASISLVGALTAASAGPVMGAVGYHGVGLVMGVVSVSALVVLVVLGRSPRPQAAGA